MQNKNLRNMLCTAIMAVSAVLPATTIQAQEYPAGAFSSLSFNHSIKDVGGHAEFTTAAAYLNPEPLKTWTGLWTADRNGQEDGALLTLPPDTVRMFYPHFSIKNVPETNNGTFVITFKIDDLHKEHPVFEGYFYKIKLEKGNLIYRTSKKVGSDREETHVIPFDYQEGEWVTLAIATDVEKKTITYYFNGKKYELINPHLRNEDVSGYLGESIYIKNPDGKYDKDDEAYVAIDEIRFYTRALTNAELAGLCNGAEGETPFEQIEKQVQGASIKMNWTWASIQIAFTILCLVYLNKPRKRLKPISAADYKGSKTNPEEAEKLLDEAYGYWGGVNTKNNLGLPLHYPDSKDSYDYSAYSYKKAIKAGSTDETFIQKANNFVRAWNSAQLRVFNGLYPMFAVLIGAMAVYVKVLLDGYGIFGSASGYDGMPEGFWNIVIYASKYILPGVLLSVIALGAASFIPRYRIWDNVIVDPDYLDDKYDAKKILIIAGIAIGVTLLSVLFGIVGILIIAALLVYMGLGIFGANSPTTKEVYRNSDGHTSVIESTSPMGIGMALSAIAVALFIAYFASIIIIFLLNIFFIYQALVNYVFKS